MEISIIHFKYSGNKQIFFLVEKNRQTIKTFIYPVAVLISETHNDQIFIEALDTTGLFCARENQTYFTQAFILKILQNPGERNYSQIECFSHPKSKLVFLKCNRSRFLLPPKRLLVYWSTLFSIICQNVICWSNYCKTINNVPHSEDNILLRLCGLQINYFDDDPKRKLKEFMNIEKFNDESSQLQVTGPKYENNTGVSSTEPVVFDHNSIYLTQYPSKQTSTPQNGAKTLIKADFFRILLTRRDFNAGGLVIGSGTRRTKELRHAHESLIRQISAHLFINQTIMRDSFEELIDKIRKSDWRSQELAHKSLFGIMNNEKKGNISANTDEISSDVTNENDHPVSETISDPKRPRLTVFSNDHKTENLKNRHEPGSTLIFNEDQTEAYSQSIYKPSSISKNEKIIDQENGHSNNDDSILPSNNQTDKDSRKIVNLEKILRFHKFDEFVVKKPLSEQATVLKPRKRTN